MNEVKQITDYRKACDCKGTSSSGTHITRAPGISDNKVTYREWSSAIPACNVCGKLWKKIEQAERPSRLDRFMARTREAVAWGTCPRLPVGAVVARGGRLISEGWNGAPSGQPHCTDVGCIVVNDHCARAIHAEDNALWFAGEQACIGADLYVSHVPCYNCANLILRARIARVIFEHIYKVDQAAVALLVTRCNLYRYQDGELLPVWSVEQVDRWGQKEKEYRI
jgi:dCMP deaminase